MSCSWSLKFGMTEIASGNQNCDLPLRRLLLAKDYLDSPCPKCLVSVAELGNRLTRIGYSHNSCAAHFKAWQVELEKHKHKILFRNSDFSCESPSLSFWNFVRSSNLSTLQLIWSKIISDEKLTHEETWLHKLITNDFESEYIEPYFYQELNYFILCGLGNADAAFDLDVSEVFEWGYWGKEDFQIDAFNDLLYSIHSDSTLQRYAMYPAEEDLTHEFKEVKDQSVVNSIKSNIEKYVIGFLNAKGGDILFGISDAGEIKGFSADQATKDSIRNLIISKIHSIKPAVPPNAYRFDFIPTFANGEIDHTVVCLQLSVEKRFAKELYRSSGGKIWIRQNGATIELKGDLLDEFLKDIDA